MDKAGIITVVSSHNASRNDLGLKLMERTRELRFKMMRDDIANNTAAFVATLRFVRFF